MLYGEYQVMMFYLSTNVLKKNEKWMFCIYVVDAYIVLRAKKRSEGDEYQFAANRNFNYKGNTL